MHLDSAVRGLQAPRAARHQTSSPQPPSGAAAQLVRLCILQPPAAQRQDGGAPAEPPQRQPLRALADKAASVVSQLLQRGSLPSLTASLTAEFMALTEQWATAASPRLPALRRDGLAALCAGWRTVQEQRHLLSVLNDSPSATQASQQPTDNTDASSSADSGLLQSVLPDPISLVTVPELLGKNSSLLDFVSDSADSKAQRTGSTKQARQAAAAHTFVMQQALEVVISPGAERRVPPFPPPPAQGWLRAAAETLVAAAAALAAAGEQPAAADSNGAMTAVEARRQEARVLSQQAVVFMNSAVLLPVKDALEPNPGPGLLLSAWLYQVTVAVLVLFMSNAVRSTPDKLIISQAVFEDMLQGLDILVDADMPLACHMRLLVASQLLALMTDLHDLGVEQREKLVSLASDMGEWTAELQPRQPGLAVLFDAHSRLGEYHLRVTRDLPTAERHLLWALDAFRAREQRSTDAFQEWSEDLSQCAFYSYWRDVSDTELSQAMGQHTPALQSVPGAVFLHRERLKCVTQLLLARRWQAQPSEYTPADLWVSAAAAATPRVLSQLFQQHLPAAATPPHYPLAPNTTHPTPQMPSSHSIRNATTQSGTTQDGTTQSGTTQDGTTQTDPSKDVQRDNKQLACDYVSSSFAIEHILSQHLSASPANANAGGAAQTANKRPLAGSGSAQPRKAGVVMSGIGAGGVSGGVGSSGVPGLSEAIAALAGPAPGLSLYSLNRSLHDQCLRAHEAAARAATQDIDTAVADIVGLIQLSAAGDARFMQQGGGVGGVDIDGIQGLILCALQLPCTALVSAWPYRDTLSHNSSTDTDMQPALLALAEAVLAVCELIDTTVGVSAAWPHTTQGWDDMATRRMVQQHTPCFVPVAADVAIGTSGNTNSLYGEDGSGVGQGCGVTARMLQACLDMKAAHRHNGEPAAGQPMQLALAMNEAAECLAAWQQQRQQGGTPPAQKQAQGAALGSERGHSCDSSIGVLSTRGTGYVLAEALAAFLQQSSSSQDLFAQADGYVPLCFNTARALAARDAAAATAALEALVRCVRQQRGLWRAPGIPSAQHTNMATSESVRAQLQGCVQRYVGNMSCRAVELCGEQGESDMLVQCVREGLLAGGYLGGEWGRPMQEAVLNEALRHAPASVLLKALHVDPNLAPVLWAPALLHFLPALTHPPHTLAHTHTHLTHLTAWRVPDISQDTLRALLLDLARTCVVHSHADTQVDTDTHTDTGSVMGIMELLGSWDQLDVWVGLGPTHRRVLRMQVMDVAMWAALQQQAKGQPQQQQKEGGSHSGAADLVVQLTTLLVDSCGYDGGAGWWALHAPPATAGSSTAAGNTNASSQQNRSGGKQRIGRSTIAPTDTHTATTTHDATGPPAPRAPPSVTHTTITTTHLATGAPTTRAPSARSAMTDATQHASVSGTTDDTGVPWDLPMRLVHSLPWGTDTHTASALAVRLAGAFLRPELVGAEPGTGDVGAVGGGSEGVGVGGGRGVLIQEVIVCLLRAWERLQRSDVTNGQIVKVLTQAGKASALSVDTLRQVLLSLLLTSQRTGQQPEQPPATATPSHSSQPGSSLTRPNRSPQSPARPAGQPTPKPSGDSLLRSILSDVLPLVNTTRVTVLLDELLVTSSAVQPAACTRLLAQVCDSDTLCKAYVPSAAAAAGVLACSLQPAGSGDSRPVAVKAAAVVAPQLAAFAARASATAVSVLLNAVLSSDTVTEALANTVIAARVGNTQDGSVQGTAAQATTGNMDSTAYIGHLSVALVCFNRLQTEALQMARPVRTKVSLEDVYLATPAQGAGRRVARQSGSPQGSAQPQQQQLLTATACAAIMQLLVQAPPALALAAAAAAGIVPAREVRSGARGVGPRDARRSREGRGYASVLCQVYERAYAVCGESLACALGEGELRAVCQAYLDLGNRQQALSVALSAPSPTSTGVLTLLLTNPRFTEPSLSLPFLVAVVQRACELRNATLLDRALQAASDTTLPYPPTTPNVPNTPPSIAPTITTHPTPSPAPQDSMGMQGSTSDSVLPVSMSSGRGTEAGVPAVQPSVLRGLLRGVRRQTFASMLLLLLRQPPTAAALALLQTWVQLSAEVAATESRFVSSMGPAGSMSHSGASAHDSASPGTSIGAGGQSTGQSGVGVDGVGDMVSPCGERGWHLPGVVWSTIGAAALRHAAPDTDAAARAVAVRLALACADQIPARGLATALRISAAGAAFESDVALPYAAAALATIDPSLIAPHYATLQHTHTQPDHPSTQPTVSGIPHSTSSNSHRQDSPLPWADPLAAAVVFMNRLRPRPGQFDSVVTERGVASLAAAVVKALDKAPMQQRLELSEAAHRAVLGLLAEYDPHDAMQTWNLWVSCRGGARLSRRVLEALLSAACETSAWTTAQTLAARLLGSDTQTLAALLQAEGNSEDLTIDELRRRAPAASKLSAAALCCAAVALMQPSSGTQAVQRHPCLLSLLHEARQGNVDDSRTQEARALAALARTLGQADM